MDMKIRLEEPVRFHTPSEDEKDLIFEIINYNEVTQRVVIRPLNLKGWGEGLIPTQLVALADLENVDKQKS